MVYKGGSWIMLEEEILFQSIPAIDWYRITSSNIGWLKLTHKQLDIFFQNAI